MGIELVFVFFRNCGIENVDLNLKVHLCTLLKCIIYISKQKLWCTAFEQKKLQIVHCKFMHAGLFAMHMSTFSYNVLDSYFEFSIFSVACNSYSPRII